MLGGDCAQRRFLHDPFGGVSVMRRLCAGVSSAGAGDDAGAAVRVSVIAARTGKRDPRYV